MIISKKVQSSGFWVQGSRFRVQGFRVSKVECIGGSGIRGSRVLGLELRGCLSNCSEFFAMG